MVLRRVRGYIALKKGMKANPGAIHDHKRILKILDTPDKIWCWGLGYVDLIHPDEDTRDYKEEGERTPTDVIRTGKANIFELIATMAYLLHHLGYRPIILYGSDNTNDIFDHPTEICVVYVDAGCLYAMGDKITKIGKHIKGAMKKDRNYVATDWTGTENIFAIMPKSPVKYRISDKFESDTDMP